MSNLLTRCIVALAILILRATNTADATAAPLTYNFAGEITEVFQNSGNIIPNLAPGDPFTGYVTFESTGWDHTSGTVFAQLNGVDLLFTGSYIYGDVTLGPATRYEIRIAGDTGGSITGSTFSAGNFGPELIDAYGSAGYTTPFPPVFDLSQFETNVFLISGGVIGAPNRSVSATGRLTQFFAAPEPGGALLAMLAASLLTARRGRACTTARP
jgi:hypothetical protein